MAEVRKRSHVGSGIVVVCAARLMRPMDHYEIQVAADGAMVLPATLRAQLQIEGGGTLTVRDDNGRLVLGNADDAVSLAQALVRRYVPGARDVTDELLAERRDEAARE